MLKRLALGLLVAWAGAGFLLEVNGAVAGWDARKEIAELPWLWRPGLTQPAELERCLAAARREIPAGTVVAFSSPDDPPGAAFYRWRWAAYFMPAHDLVQEGEPAARPESRISCGPGGQPRRVGP
jgi:hypothetical protein